MFERVENGQQQFVNTTMCSAKVGIVCVVSKHTGAEFVTTNESLVLSLLSLYIFFPEDASEEDIPHPIRLGFPVIVSGYSSINEMSWTAAKLRTCKQTRVQVL